MEHTFVLHQNRLVSIGSDVVADVPSSASPSPPAAPTSPPPSSASAEKSRKRPHPSSARLSQSNEVKPSLLNNPSYYHRPKRHSDSTRSRPVVPTPPVATTNDYSFDFASTSPLSMSPPTPLMSSTAMTSPITPASAFSVCTPTTPYGVFNFNQCPLPLATSPIYQPPWTPLDYQGWYTPEPDLEPETKKRRPSHDASLHQDEAWMPSMPPFDRMLTSSYFDPSIIGYPPSLDSSWPALAPLWQSWIPY